MYVFSAEARTSTALHPQAKPCQRKTRGAASWGEFSFSSPPPRPKIFTYQSNQLMKLDKVALYIPISAHANQILLSNRCSSPTPLGSPSPHDQFVHSRVPRKNRIRRMMVREREKKNRSPVSLFVLFCLMTETTCSGSRGPVGSSSAAAVLRGAGIPCADPCNLERGPICRL